jgi:RNA polymerase sigma-70 factor (ECF subfamily)
MLEEKLLVWKFKRGNPDAVCRIYERYRDDLLRLAAALLNEKHEAEDVVHDVFISFVRSAKRFRLTGSLKAYLSTCVANRARNINLKKQRRKDKPLDDRMNISSDTQRPDQWIITTEQFEIFKECLDQLPFEQREVIVLRLQGDFKFTQISVLQQTSIKTVQSRYRYGLEKLRTLLNGKVKL